MRRRAGQSIVANPVLVGAVTILVITVAVFLAYNANSGLPFVPTKQINAEISNGANLIAGNEVRQGGYRIGVVEDMKPVALSDGTTGALLQLKLDKTVGDIPADTSITIRPRSSLGLKYVEVTKGTSSRMLTDGDTIPKSQSTVPVELDEFFNIFDEPTREGAQRSLEGFGDAFALRGQSLNRTIEEAPRTLRVLEPVARSLADPDTELKNFFSSLQRTVSAIAPVADVNARLFTTMADTFEAFSRDTDKLKETISKSPETLDVSTRSLAVQQPFLEDTADFSHSLRLASHELRGGLPDLNEAVHTGTPVLERSVTLNNDLQAAMANLNALVSQPETPAALTGLTATVNTLNPTLRFVGPYQTVCNYFTYFWTTVAEHFSEPDPTGQSQRALLNSGQRMDNGVQIMNAVRPSNGAGGEEFFHGQPYSAAINSDGTADCEFGQRGYMETLHEFGDQKVNVVLDPHTPGSQGPTFKSDDDTLPLEERALGRTKVPPGQTFTRYPDTGPQLPDEVKAAMIRRHGGRFTAFQAGMFALVIVVAATYLGFTKAIPFRSHFEIKAVFKTYNNLRPNSPVRIAGVPVGKVTKVEALRNGNEAAIVTMRIDKKGLPIHDDATAAIRPRIFLEGNFFVDIEPGTPSGKELEDDDVIPVNQTKTPVQLDEVLTALQSDTREDLKVLLEELSRGVSGRGSRGYNASIQYWEGAYRDSAIVNEASLGEREHDLSQYIKNAGSVAESLDRNAEQLKSLITDFNTTAGAFAREDDALRTAVGKLPRTLRAGEPALAKLNASFPPLRRLVRDLRPTVRSSDPALEAGIPFVREGRRLVSEAELGTLVDELRAATPTLTRLTDVTVPVQEQVGQAAAACQNEVILPWSQDTIPDSKFQPQGPVFEESVQWLPGIAGESHSGDANGQWFRVLAGGGNYQVVYGPNVALTDNPIQGTNPPKPAFRPPIRADVPCETQTKPNLATQAGPAPIQRKLDTSLPAYKQQWLKDKLQIAKFVKAQLKQLGIKGIKVSTKDLTSAQIDAIAKRAQATKRAAAERIRKAAGR